MSQGDQSQDQSAIERWWQEHSELDYLVAELVAAVERGEGASERTWVYIQMRDVRAVRDRRWKLFSDGRLFDTRSDPLEKSPFGPGEGGAPVQSARARLEAVLAGLG